MIDSFPQQHCRLGIALLLCLLLPGCEEPPRYRPLLEGATVLAFGDSVTHGTGAKAGEDYPSQLAGFTGWHVINAGIPGDLARDAGARLPALLQEHSPALVIVELGGNDFLRKRPAAQVKSELNAMLDMVVAADAIPVLVAVPRLSLLRASTGTLKDAPLYAELAEERNIVLVEDVFADTLSDEALRSDPIHPNALGYRQLADSIATRLRSAGLLE